MRPAYDLHYLALLHNAYDLHFRLQFYCVISHLAQLFLGEEEGAQTLEGAGGHPCRGAAQEEGDHPTELELKKNNHSIFIRKHCWLSE